MGKGLTTMEGSIAILPCILVSIIYLASGTVDVHFLKQVPHLSNTPYWNTYFRCHTVGETLQWQINNNNLNRYQRQNVALVLFGNGYNFSYYATLLSSETISENEFSFDSILIVTSSSNSSVDVACSNGSLLVTALNKTNKPDIEEATNTSSIFLEYVLTDDKDDSKHTSIFICGVENNFMKLLVNKDDDKSFLFSQFDNVGDERRLPQDIDTIVEQQAILIRQNAPYELVTVMFVTHDLPVTITCGYNQKNVSLTSRQLMMTTEVSEITESLTTSIETSKPPGSMTSSSSISVSSTMTNEDEDDLLNVVTPTVCGVAVASIIIIVLISYLCYKNKRKKKNSRNSQTVELESLVPSHSTDVSTKNGTKERPIEQELDQRPLKGDQLDKKSDEITLDIVQQKSKSHNQAYCEKVMYIMTILREDVLTASSTFIMAPEEGTKTIIKIDHDVYVGRIGNHIIGLIKHGEKEECFMFVKKSIEKHFPNAKYLISMGLCRTFDPEVANMGDVLISDKIVVHKEGENNQVTCSTTKVNSEIKKIFAPTQDDDSGLQVTSSRKSRQIIGSIASCLNFEERRRYLQFIAQHNPCFGVEKVAGHFVSLQTDGIKMQDETIKRISVIAIKAVCGYSNGEVDNNWTDKAAQAVLHYVTTKIRGIEFPSPDSI